MATFLEHGLVRNDVYISLVYQVDENKIVSCATLNETQLAAFSDYVHETHSHMPRHGNSLEIASYEETRLWNIFCETLLVCDCGNKNVKFNPYCKTWKCDICASGLEE
jgi:hypothetical protein